MAVASLTSKYKCDTLLLGIMCLPAGGAITLYIGYMQKILVCCILLLAATRKMSSSGLLNRLALVCRMRYTVSCIAVTLCLRVLYRNI